jgi:glycerophosphoryl diester phosphodiesterase
MEVRSLRAIRALDPSVRVGLSVPKLRKDPRERRYAKYPAYAALGAWRELLPFRAARAIRAGAYDALMSHHAIVTPRLVRAVQGAGGELYVWTVDDAGRIAALEALGVDGVITNDPRLFS